MSYPDLIEQDGNYWITETNKVDARCHKIPNEFLHTLWSQFDIHTPATQNLVAAWKAEEIPLEGALEVPESAAASYAKGFTIDFRLKLANLAPGQLILSSKDKQGKLVELKTGEFGAIEITLSDGEYTDSWSSDPGLVKASGVEHSIAVTVDHGPRIIQFMIDGTLSNGRDLRQFGWGRYTADMKDFQFHTIETQHMAGESVNITSKITNLSLYNRSLLNTELIGNHRYFKATQ